MRTIFLRGKNKIPYCVFVIFLFALHGISIGQTQLLKAYDFDKGGYTLLGIRSQSDRNELAETLGEFYTDDIAVLNEFKKEWVFKKPSPQYACGYHYIVYICKDGNAIENFAINLNCNEIATDNGYFFFDTKKLSVFAQKVRKPEVRFFNQFTSVEQARSERRRILEDKNLIMTGTPDWTNYEGEFNFTYACPKELGDCVLNEEKALARLREEIRSAYPGEVFEVYSRGGSDDILFVDVKCNKTLADKFRLYGLEQVGWGAYDLRLGSYWKAQ